MPTSNSAASGCAAASAASASCGDRATRRSKTCGMRGRRTRECLWQWRTAAAQAHAIHHARWCRTSGHDITAAALSDGHSAAAGRLSGTDNSGLWRFVGPPGGAGPAVVLPQPPPPELVSPLSNAATPRAADAGGPPNLGGAGMPRRSGAAAPPGAVDARDKAAAAAAPAALACSCAAAAATCCCGCFGLVAPALLPRAAAAGLAAAVRQLPGSAWPWPLCPLVAGCDPARGVGCCAGHHGCCSCWA